MKTTNELVKAAEEMTKYINLMATRQMRTHAEFGVAMSRWQLAIENAKCETNTDAQTATAKDSTI